MMMSLSDGIQADIIKAFNSTSRYLDDLMNTDNLYFDGMVTQRGCCCQTKVISLTIGAWNVRTLMDSAGSGGPHSEEQL